MVLCMLLQFASFVRRTGGERKGERDRGRTGGEGQGERDRGRRTGGEGQGEKDGGRRTGGEGQGQGEKDRDRGKESDRVRDGATGTEEWGLEQRNWDDAKQTGTWWTVLVGKGLRDRNRKSAAASECFPPLSSSLLSSGEC